MRRTLALAAIAVTALACQSQSERQDANRSDRSNASAKVPQVETAASREPDPFCRTYRILVNGTLRGYLVRYEEMPAHMTTERRFATGTAFIQNLDFEELGFITPNGSLYRVGSGASPGTAHSERVAQGELLKSLSLFYDPEGAVRVTLEPITASAATAAKSATPPGKEVPKAEAGKAESKDKAPEAKEPAEKAEEKSDDGG